MDSIFPNIDNELKKRNMHYRELAYVAGVSEIQMYRRLRGHTSWKLYEAMKICKFFEHYDMNILFARR